MFKSWVNTILRIWILIPLLSVSGAAFALASQATFDQVTMFDHVKVVAVDDGSIINKAQNDMQMENMGEHCEDQNQCDHQCSSCIGCAIPPAEFTSSLVNPDSAPPPYQTKPSHGYLAQLIKPPRA